MDKFIFREKKSLSGDTCEKLINLFNQSSDTVRNVRGYTYATLQLQRFPSIVDPLNLGIQKYLKKHKFLREGPGMWGWSDYFLLQKYEVGECYKGEHMEHGGSEYDCRRILGWMVYLNDCDGGTRWPQQRFTTRPRQGDLYIWPAGWTHSHHGLPASKEKYILTGWCELVNK